MCICWLASRRIALPYNFSWCWCLGLWLWGGTKDSCLGRRRQWEQCPSPRWCCKYAPLQQRTTTSNKIFLKVKNLTLQSSVSHSLVFHLNLICIIQGFTCPFLCIENCPPCKYQLLDLSVLGHVRALLLHWPSCGIYTHLYFLDEGNTHKSIHL